MGLSLLDQDGPRVREVQIMNATHHMSQASTLGCQASSMLGMINETHHTNLHLFLLNNSLQMTLPHAYTS